VPVLSNAEGSRHGKRVRKFDADEILALAACFDIPPSYFFTDPERTDAMWHLVAKALREGEQ
jgi:hypothetical protein